ncbi:MAG: hypothetical protein ACI9S9_003752, partial [Planctomycetota bacterium]
EADLGEADNGIDAIDMLALSGMPLGDTRLIDTSLPIVVAVTSKRATPPTVTAVVPVTNVAAYTKSLEAASITPTVDGNYVAIPMIGPYKRAAAAPDVLTRLRPGTISLHADLESLTKTYKVAILSGIDLFEQQIAAVMEMGDPNIDSEAFAEMYGSIARAITDSTKTLDLSLDWKGGMCDFDVSLDVKPGSAMAGWSSPAIDLTPLVRGMSGKGGLEVLFQMDMKSMMPRLIAMMESLGDIYPEEFQTVLTELMAAYEGIYEQIESGMVMEGDLFGEEGMRMTAQMMPKDSDKFVTMISDLLVGDALKKLGVVAEAAKTSTDGDMKITDINLAIDMNKLMTLSGQPAAQEDQVSAAFQAMFVDGMAIRMAQRGDRLVMTFGKDREAAAKATLTASDGAWTPMVQTALDRLEGCNPLIIERIDFASMMAAAFATMAKSGTRVPNVPKDLSSNILFFGGVNGNQWRGGFSVEVGGLVEISRLMIPR